MGMFMGTGREGETLNLLNLRLSLPGSLNTYAWARIDANFGSDMLYYGSTSAQMEQPDGRESSKRAPMNTAPRLIYYSDAHHFHAKRLDPPLNIHKMRWPIDELTGTGVEMLAFGLGFGDVYFHQTKIGRVVGQEQEVWNSFINWRIMRMVRDALDMGTDQVREVIARGREMDIPVFPSLKLQDPTPRYQERCGWLKWRHGMDVTLAEHDDRFPNHATEWCLDYTNVVVRENKKALLREILEEYRAEGVELDFMFFPLYFRKGQTEVGAQVMSKFVGDVRVMVDEIGRAQNRRIPIMARVWHRRDDNLDIGLDVESWITDGAVDLVVGQTPHSLLDTGVTDGAWIADAANDAGISAYLRPGFHLQDLRASIANIEMFRALGQTLRNQGFAGMYLGYLPWPFAEAEHRLLREAAYPEMTARLNKRYYLPPREDLQTYVRSDTRRIPVRLEEGARERIAIFVADDVEAAVSDEETREAVLTLGFHQFCVEDEVTISFNGADLTIKRSDIYEPSRGQYWLRWRLDAAAIRKGENELGICIVKKEPTAGFARTLTDVEIHLRYREFDRPETLDTSTVPPPS